LAGSSWSSKRQLLRRVVWESGETLTIASSNYLLVVWASNYLDGVSPMAVDSTFRLPVRKVPEFQSSRVPEFQSSRVPEFQSSRVPEFQSSRVPEFQSSLPGLVRDEN
jgi:hypothetical protein